MNYCYYATHNQHHVRLPSSDSYLYASDSETSSSESAITSSVSGSSSGSSSSASVTPRRMDLVDLDMVKLINTGGSGKVYLVRDKIDRQHLALKVIPKSRNMYSCNKKKVTAEKSIHSFLTMESDDFFLPLVATWCDSENYYLASEYIPGGDLALRIMQQRTFDEVEARFYIAELIVSLERLHARKIIHRDIKPSNILIRPDGHVVLADFGVSKRFEVDVDAELDAFYADYVYDGETSSWSEEGCETGCGSANASLYMTSDDCGTPYFMSPEQHRGDKYSFEVDHWAVGVMLYRMVTGKMPFGDCAMNKGQIARSVLEDDVSFAGHSSTVSMVTQDFILGLLAKDPCHRLHPSEIRRHPFFYGIDWSLVEHRELEAPWLPYIAPIPKQSRPIFAGYRELQNPSWTEERDAAAESFTWYSPYARLRHVCPPKGSGSSHSSSSGSSSRPTSNFDSVRWKSWIRGIFCSNEGNGKSSTRRSPRRRR